jgi:hypothetical protein
MNDAELVWHHRYGPLDPEEREVEASAASYPIPHGTALENVVHALQGGSIIDESDKSILHGRSAMFFPAMEIRHLIDSTR